MDNSEQILSVNNLTVQIETDTATLKILNGISFNVRRGETLGIVGESGCGKSMTALSVMRLINTPPAKIDGTIELCGKDMLKLSAKEMRSIRGNRISMIFQEPMTSLNPVYTVGNQIMEVFRLHQGMTKRQAKQQAIDALSMVNVALPEKRVNCYPYQLSGGIRQRVMIAMALACQPELLIADEPTTALDVTIQAQVLELMRKLRDELGTGIVFITHDLGVVSEMCSRVIVLYCGEIMEEADVQTLFTSPKHPYTQGLLAAIPRIGQKEKLYVIPGTVPPASDFPKGCVFEPRCEYATEECTANKPNVTQIAKGHKVRCFLFEGKESE